MPEKKFILEPFGRKPEYLCSLQGSARKQEQIIIVTISSGISRSINFLNCLVPEEISPFLPLHHVIPWVAMYTPGHPYISPIDRHIFDWFTA